MAVIKGTLVFCQASMCGQQPINYRHPVYLSFLSTGSPLHKDFCYYLLYLKPRASIVTSQPAESSFPPKIEPITLELVKILGFPVRMSNPLFLKSLSFVSRTSLFLVHIETVALSTKSSSSTTKKPSISFFYNVLPITLKCVKILFFMIVYISLKVSLPSVLFL